MRRLSTHLFLSFTFLLLACLVVMALGGTVRAAPPGQEPPPTDTPTATATTTSTSTATPTGTATATGTATSTSTATLTSTATTTTTASSTATVTATLQPPAHIVISEFRTRGPDPNVTSDEFIELFNPSASAVNIGGWQVRISSGCGSYLSTLVVVPANIILQAGQHYLVANTASVVSNPDQTFSVTIADNGGIAILASNGTIMDQVGMCATTTYLEGFPLMPMAGSADQSYKRLFGGCVDTDDNSTDFEITTLVGPQNRASPATICPGAVTPTPSRTPTPTVTKTPTKTQGPTPVPTAIRADIVINEFLPHPRTDWNADGKANFGDEYIELINRSSQAISLGGWKLDDDVGGSSPFNLPNITLQPRQIVHYYASETGISLSDGGDTVRLINPSGYTVDAHTYEVVTRVDVTWCRLPDGTGGWGFVCHPTPGRPNTRLEAVSPPPDESPDHEGVPLPSLTCLTDSSVDDLVIGAECSATGARVWNWALWGSETETWLRGIIKWDIVFK